MVSTPLPDFQPDIQPKPCASIGAASGSGPIWSTGPAPVRLAEGVAAAGQRDGLLVVHGHSREGLADVPGGGQRIGVAVWAFGIDVNQAHLHRGERVLEITVAGIARLGVVGAGQPLVLAAPVDVFLGLPHVLAAPPKPKVLKPMDSIRDVAGEDHQVGPRDRVARISA